MEPTVHYLRDYQPPAYLINTIELKIDLHDDKTLVTSKLTIIKNPKSTDPEAKLKLDGEELILKSIQLNAKLLEPSDYTLTAHHLEIPNFPDHAVLEILTEIQPKLNTALSGLYESNGMYCTQCEAEGFRRITFFMDRPDVLSIYTVTITADKKRYPRLLSNGNLIDHGDLAEGRHYATWHDPFEKPCYLFATVAGDLAVLEDQFVTKSGRTVQLKIFTEHGQLDRCQHAMDSLKKAMKWDEEVFQREYDLDILMIVAVADFNMGAMENKGLNIFNNQYILADRKTATDHDFHAIEAVIGHEYFHNWSGNRVTCRDWFQLSLKEGLTIFREQEFSADMWSRALSRINEVRLLKTRQFSEDAGPMAHPVRPQSYIEINNFYTVTVYHKGSEVIRMLKTLIGEDAFMRGMQLYFASYDGQAVTIDDFVASMAETSGKDLKLFMRWYDQAGTPEIKVKTYYDEVAKTYHLELEQNTPPTPGQSEKLPLCIPFAVGLLNQYGQEIPLHLKNDTEITNSTKVLVLTDKKHHFEFLNVPEQPVASLLRNFSAPVKLITERSNIELRFLLQHDTDPFNRWEAAQEFATNLQKDLINQIENGQPFSLPGEFIETYRYLLQDAQIDPALLAEILLFPDEGYLAELFSPIDIGAIIAAHDFMIHQLGDRLQEELFAAYERNHESAYRFEPEAVGKRMLKNICLSLLVEAKQPKYYALAYNCFSNADNMTDALAAMAALTHHESPERERVLKEFYEQWKGDAVVLNKWFAVQASARLPDALERVKALLKHPAFDMTNPNKVRSVVGVFSRRNFPAFHAIDGSGYRFLADNVIQLNTINPHIAASLIEPLIHWRKFDEVRQKQMHNELERISKEPKLARDLYEMVTKAI